MFTLFTILYRFFSWEGGDTTNANCFRKQKTWSLHLEHEGSFLDSELEK